MREVERTPLGNEILDFTPSKLPPDLLRALGLIATSSAHAEGAVEMAVAGLLGVDGERGWAVTTHMSAPLRFNVLRSLAEIRISDAESLDELDKIIERLKAAQDKRNVALHSSYGVKPSTEEVINARVQARTHLDVKLIPIASSQIERDATELFESSLSLISFLIERDLIPALPEHRSRGVNTPHERKKRRKQVA